MSARLPPHTVHVIVRKKTDGERIVHTKPLAIEPKQPVCAGGGRACDAEHGDEGALEAAEAVRRLLAEDGRAHHRVCEQADTAQGGSGQAAARGPARAKNGQDQGRRHGVVPLDYPTPNRPIRKR